MLRAIKGLRQGVGMGVTSLGGYSNLYRLRVGDYRVVFEMEDFHVVVGLIAHRREVYEALRRRYSKQAALHTDHHGWLPLTSLVPTERPVTEREPGTEGKKYRDDLLDDIRQNGFKEPLEVDYARTSHRAKPKLHLVQGHHRYWAAKQLGMTHVPVYVRSWYGDPPGLLHAPPKQASRQQEGDQRPYGDYTLRYQTKDEGERKPRHIITAHDKDANQVGELNWYGTTGTIHHIDVEPEHSRQGLATAMWDWSQQMTPKARHSSDRTTQGDAWAKSVGGPLPRKKSGVVPWEDDRGDTDPGRAGQYDRGRGTSRLPGPVRGGRRSGDSRSLGRGNERLAQRWTISITRPAQADYRSLPPQVRSAILRLAKSLLRDPRAAHGAHKLKGREAWAAGVNVGGVTYRLAYVLDGQHITVFVAGPHEGFYNKLRRRMGSRLATRHDGYFLTPRGQWQDVVEHDNAAGYNLDAHLQQGNVRVRIYMGATAGSGGEMAVEMAVPLTSAQRRELLDEAASQRYIAIQVNSPIWPYRSVYSAYQNTDEAEAVIAEAQRAAKEAVAQAQRVTAVHDIEMYRQASSGEWHNSDGLSLSELPHPTDAELYDHLITDHGSNLSREDLPTDLDELDQYHAEDHSLRGECGAHEDGGSGFHMAAATDPPVAHIPTAMRPHDGKVVHDPIGAAWEAMGAPLEDRPEERHPERYEPNKGFGVHLKHGETETRTSTNADGVATQYEVTPYHHTQRKEHPPLPGGDGLPMHHSDGEARYLGRVPNSEKPVPHVWRIMHDGEYQQAKKRGYFQSDERMNLGDEGTVASDRATGSFYASTGPNRIVRMRHHPEDGWKRDRDGYIKTHKPIPFERADLVSPIIHNNRKPRGPGGKYGFDNEFHIEGLEHEVHKQGEARKVQVEGGKKMAGAKVYWCPECEHYTPHPRIQDKGLTCSNCGTFGRALPKNPRNAMYREAHGGGTTNDGVTIRHCPLCGSGQVLARSDGGVACEFCDSTFVVTVQPQFSGMPQTIDGVPYQIPGMPEESEQLPPGEEGMFGEEEDPNPVLPGEEEEAPPEEAAEPGGDQPPWLKGKQSSLYFITDDGVALNTEAYQRHLALKHADGNREVVLSQVRQAVEETR